jgi:DNA helicase MCM9
MAGWGEINRSKVPGVKDYGKFLSVQGTVIGSRQARILEYRREYRCTKCDHEFSIDADYDQYYAIQVPPQCPNPEKPCKSTSMKPVGSPGCPTHCKDYQEIKLQERANSLGLGIVPRSMWVTLEDDLVGSCKPGDDVTVW